MPLPFPVSDLTKETTTTEGLGALFLDPSPPLRTLLAGVGAGTPAWFCVFQDGIAWEVFIGQVTAGTGGGKDSLSRDTFIASSTGSTVNFGEGTKIVYNVVPSREVLARGRALQEILDAGLTATAQTNLGGTTTGKALFTAASAAAARTAIGATTVGGNVFTAADAAAARTVLGLLSAALRNIGVASGTEVPDRAAADARYQAIAAAGNKYWLIPTSGTLVKVPFYLSTAPTQWTRITTGIEGAAIRLAHTGGGITQLSGRQDVANAFAKGHALTVAELAAHTHPIGRSAAVNTSGSNIQRAQAGGAGDPTATDSAGSGQEHTHDIHLAYSDFLLASFTG